MTDRDSLYNSYIGFDSPARDNVEEFIRPFEPVLRGFGGGGHDVWRMDEVLGKKRRVVKCEGSRVARKKPN